MKYFPTTSITFKTNLENKIIPNILFKYLKHQPNPFSGLAYKTGIIIMKFLLTPMVFLTPPMRTL